VAEFIGHGVFMPARLREVAQQVVVQTPLGDLTDVAECPLPCAFADGACDLLLRADDIVHDDDAPVKAAIVRKAFRGSEFLYTLRLASGETVMAHVPSHHDHRIGEWIGIRAQVDHVVTFNRACPPEHRDQCQQPCSAPCAQACAATLPHLRQEHSVVSGPARRA
jgi:iron(III) transport system ATP-binding protein